MSSIRQMQNVQKTNLLTNVINTWIKENNNISNNKNNNKIENVSDWPKRSPYEFYNKNLIVPNNCNVQNNLAVNKSQKLNGIKDKVNQLITNNRIGNDDLNNENIKVSLISPNIKSNTGSVTIKPLSNEPKINNEIISKVKMDRNRNNNEEKNIKYDFGYTKEERIEPLKLSLNKYHSINFEDDKENKNKNFVNDEYNLTFDKKKNGDINIEENLTGEIITDHIIIEKEPKILILPQSEEEIKYYKKNDLFDEEIKENDLNDIYITQNQMNILDYYSNNNYKKFQEISKQKEFRLKHPYLEYDYCKMKLADKNNIDDNMIYYNKNKIQENLYKMLQKQKVIINDIAMKKNNIYNNNMYNNKINLNKKYRLARNQSSIYENNNNPEKERYLERKIFRSYSTNDYYKEGKWEKRQEMLERKKEYSYNIILNERKMREEREKERLIQRIRLNEKIKKEMENYKEDEDEDEYEIQEDNENEIKLPEIKQSRNVPNDEQNNNFKNKVYTNSYAPLKKYKLKKNEQEKIINTMIKHNPKLEQLLLSNELYNMKLDKIKSSIK